MSADKPILLNSLSDNSELKIKPFFHSNLKDNLEGIVFEAEPQNEKGILEKVFSDKSKNCAWRASLGVGPR